MEKKDKFQAFISAFHSQEYWSELGAVEAIHLADELSVESWDSVCQDWRSFDSNAQKRIADIAGEARHLTNSTIEMLLEMLSSTSREVVEASIDGLNSISSKSIDLFDAPETLVKLRSIDTDNRLVQLVLTLLVKRLEDTLK